MDYDFTRGKILLTFCFGFMALSGFIFVAWLGWISPEEIVAIWMLLGILSMAIFFLTFHIVEFISSHRKKSG